jgi:hypothetical protein
MKRPPKGVSKEPEIVITKPILFWMAARRKLFVLVTGAINGGNCRCCQPLGGQPTSYLTALTTQQQLDERFTRG